MSTKTISKSGFQSTMTALLAGIDHSLPATVKSIVLNGNSMTVTQLETALQGYISEYTAVQSAKTAYAQAISERKADNAAARALVKALETFLKLQFGSNAATLAKFGITLKTPSQKTVASKAIGIAKSKATREAKKSGTAAPEATAVTVSEDGVALAPSPAEAVSPATTPPSVTSGAVSK